MTQRDSGPPVRTERAGQVAVIELDAPPVNALGARLRSALMAAIAAAAADPQVQAVVIRGAGRGFSAGADIAEFGQPAAAAPSLSDVILALEGLGKPVIAALHGPVLGGGLELALGAHHRIAAAGTMFGFPEVALGLVPGAGGTQRAPRLAGAARTLDLMLTGRRIGPEEALAAGLIDGVVDTGLAEAALALAAELGAEAAAGRAPVPTRDRRDGMSDPAAYQAEVAAARAAAEGRLPAPGRIVDCVAAAQLLPFDQGLAFERAAFVEMRESPESAGLRHAFRAERRAAHGPEAGIVPQPLNRVAVLGLAPPGAALALAMAAAGLPVAVLERDRAGLAEGLARIADDQERQLAEGRLSAADRDAAWARLAPTTDPAALAGADLIFCTGDGTGWAASLVAASPPGAVVAAALVAGDADALPGAAVWLQLTPPRLLEVAAGPNTPPVAVATGLALARRLGCVGIRTAAVPGLVLARLRAALARAADHVLEEGATPATLDAALRGFGMALGPCEAQDRRGLVAAAGADSGLAGLLIAAGRVGAGGAGFYPPGADAGGGDDPEVLALLAELRRAKGIEPRRLGAEEMRRRCLTALANEGARLVGDAVALRPSDLDAAMLAAADFPRWEGGPMFWADRRGLLVLRADMRRWAETAPDHWSVAPLIDELIRTGRRLADLDAA